MANDESREEVSLQELAYSGMLQTEAITRLLVKKGIITKEELLEEVIAVNAEQHKKAGGVGIG